MYLYLEERFHFAQGSETRALTDKRSCTTKHSPLNDALEDLDLLLDLFKNGLPSVSLGRGGALDLVLAANEGKRATRAVVVDVRASRLKEAADEHHLEEGVRVLEELEGRTRRDELGSYGVILGGRDGEKVREKGVPED